jgi:SnoaL-like domain
MKKLIALVLLVAGVAAHAEAQQPPAVADHLGALNHVSCYPFGLDMIGRGETQAGIDAWKQCFAPDFKFTVSLGFGEPTECPGEKCTLAGANSIEKRATFARRIYDSAGYVRTSHQLSNQMVTATGADTLHVKSYISAWHIKGDGSIVTGVGVWEVDLARNGQGWLITSEKLTIVGAGTLQSLRR